MLSIRGDSMYQLYLWVQYIGIALLLLEIGIILYQDASFNQSLVLIFNTAALINSIGYLMELQANTMELALYAVKFIYVGKPFISLSTLLFVLNYCRIKYPRPLGLLLFFLHAGVTISVLTCEYHTLFYTSIAYTRDGVYPHLILGHGIIYNCYMCLILIYSVIMIACCLYRCKRCQDFYERKNIARVALITLIPIAGFFIYLSGVTQGYDITAPSYILCATILLICSIRYNFLGTLQLAKDNVLDNLKNGVIVLDNSLELLYVNEAARKLYSQLDDTNLDTFLAQLYPLISTDQKISFQDRYYAVTMEPIYHKTNQRGTMILLDDVTDDHTYTQRLEHDVAEKAKEITHIQQAIIAGFANLVEARDGVTGMHIKNTSYYVNRLCLALQQQNYHPELLTDDYIQKVIHAAPLHDIGKIAIPDSILCKPGKLTDEEFTIIKTHASIGSEMIRDILKDANNDPTLQLADEMAHYHHERWDGNGYPCKLKEEEIPVCARIMAIADVYDALLSKRSYKEPFSEEKALSILKESSGTQFEPAIVEAFISSQFSSQTSVD